MFTFYSSCKTNVYSILQQWYLGIMYYQRFETNMMLFNIKQCRWRSVARQEFEQCPELLLGAADRRRMTPPVCVHT